jgi:hypothetical protein
MRAERLSRQARNIKTGYPVDRSQDKPRSVLGRLARAVAPSSAAVSSRSVIRHFGSGLAASRL